MNYRSANDFNPPFKVTVLIDETTPFKVSSGCGLTAFSALVSKSPF